jgi:hypothetical protein
MYHYIIKGQDREGNAWVTSGTVSADDSAEALTAARRDSFLQLTKGKAVYGNPATCRGPYKITSVTIVS